MSAPPHDLNAELAVLGAMLSLPSTYIPEAAKSLTAGDFYSPNHGAAFDVIVNLWREGHDIDATAVSSRLRAIDRDPGWQWFVNATSVAGTVGPNAKTIIEHRARRQILTALAEGRDGAMTAAVDPWGLIDRLAAHLASINAPTGKPSPDLHQIDEWIDEPESDDTEWVVPGLFRRDWRVMVVGEEGLGKSYLARQFTMAAAQGIHPLYFDEMPPIRTLLVDLENPRGALAGTFRNMRTYIDASTYRRGEAWVWHRPGGFDLRSRALRAEFEANVALARPDLVCIGPMYKAYSKGARETDEMAVVEVQQALDDLRTRYGFALFLEHHAPQADSSGRREMRPYGSSYWLRWPEMGIGMVKGDAGAGREVNLERWRGDRMANEWPTRLVEGAKWPWVGA